MNLLEETVECIEDSGFSIEDIVFIGSKCGQYRCSWDEFILIADFEYDESYGRQVVASDLVVSFVGGSVIKRWEYDGSEGWECDHKAKEWKITKNIKSLTGGAWSTLAQMNEGLN